MIKPRHIEKFWNTLIAGNGSANYYTIGRQVFGGSWKRAWVDELAQAPVLAGLVTTSTERVKLSGRIPLRYALTPRGWDLARTWKLLPASGDLPPDELRRQFERLAATLNPWAEELQRMANFGRKRMAEPPPQEKKKRHRSEADLAARKRWVERKVAERVAAGTTKQQEPTPPRPSWQPSPQPEAPRVQPEASVASAGPYRGAQSWMNDIGFVSSPVPRPAPPPSANADLLGKIARAGYQTKNGRVLYGGDRWITPEEWLRLMPNTLS